MIEADDAYTGSHSQQVVELVLAVADELGVDADTRRDAEFAALLHDVGKIHVPNEIINKRGPLDDAEWAVMRRHTIDGEAMLARVGGLLGRVGGIVRASHEHYDGSGYPDGLAGEQIPLAARIVTLLRRVQRDDDRPLVPQGADARGGASPSCAACAGTQFDPARRRRGAAGGRARRRRRERACAAGARRVAVRVVLRVERAHGVDPDAGPVAPARLACRRARGASGSCPSGSARTRRR